MIDLYSWHTNPDASEYSRNRYATEAQRLYAVLDHRLAAHENDDPIPLPGGRS